MEEFYNTTQFLFDEPFPCEAASHHSTLVPATNETRSNKARVFGKSGRRFVGLSDTLQS